MKAKKKKPTGKEDAEARATKLTRLNKRIRKATTDLKVLDTRRKRADRLLQELIADHNAKFEIRHARLEKAETACATVRKRFDYAKLEKKLIDDPLGRDKLRLARYEEKAHAIRVKLYPPKEKK